MIFKINHTRLFKTVIVLMTELPSASRYTQFISVVLKFQKMLSIAPNVLFSYCFRMACWSHCLAALLLIVALGTYHADACTCMPAHPQEQFCRADYGKYSNFLFCIQFTICETLYEGLFQAIINNHIYLSNLFIFPTGGLDKAFNILIYFSFYISLLFVQLQSSKQVYLHICPLSRIIFI